MSERLVPRPCGPILPDVRDRLASLLRCVSGRLDARIERVAALVAYYEGHRLAPMWFGLTAIHASYWLWSRLSRRVAR